MSKVFKKGKPRPIDPREWKKNTPTLTFFNDNTGQQQEQQQQCYTSKLVKLINKDSCSSTLSYNLFGIPLHRKHLRQQQHQQTLRGVKQFRRRPKVEIILNPKSEPELQVRVPYGLSRYLKPHQIEGVRFMWKHIVDRKQGCVIAHSMGLEYEYIYTLYSQISYDLSLVKANIITCSVNHIKQLGI
ncbi:hypothetical protein BDA99DRAFT_86875 [Phascolomyces articulosus]|uniref:Uncharacterized protein n=1 Tax=Phascolomyces articulosus TaxID=60185 RepID=A0AAD5JYQ4_9FUNG|nr:hypothetical protein BDA99DRAFT_86875 [Phascolomyces articulosus]